MLFAFLKVGNHMVRGGLSLPTSVWGVAVFSWWWFIYLVNVWVRFLMEGADSLRYWFMFLFSDLAFFPFIVWGGPKKLVECIVLYVLYMRPTYQLQGSIEKIQLWKYEVTKLPTTAKACTVFFISLIISTGFNSSSLPLSLSLLHCLHPSLPLSFHFLLTWGGFS